MFTSERLNATNRLTEVRQLLETIKALESTDPLKPDSTEVLILRGLFYVHLYATLEHSVNQSVERLLRAVIDLKVQTAHFEPLFLGVALDPEFSSFGDTGKSTRWSKRIAFLKKQTSLEETTLNLSIFSMYVQNIWKKDLLQVFECLYINEPIVPDSNLIHYIDEIVNKRNAVAHGRESPVRVGLGTRSSDLLIRLDAISRIITHLIQCFEKHLAHRNFIRIGERAKYSP